jgi:hypothetical protein
MFTLCTRDIRKITYSWLLTKKERENLLYTKKMYVLKLRLVVATAGIKELAISGNKFLCVCVKEVSRL